MYPFQLDTTITENKENTLSLTINSLNTSNSVDEHFFERIGPEITLSNSVLFQVKAECVDVNSSNLKKSNNIVLTMLFIKFLKKDDNDDCSYNIELSSSELNIKGKYFENDDGIWQLIYKKATTLPSFDLTAKLTTIYNKTQCFAPLHEDAELTDFMLKGEDGVVHVHRAVLAASSPVLRRMLGGTWRETTEGLIKVPGSSKTTLQNLKDYLYLHILPENGLEYLVLLASFYMMPSLEKRAIEKIIASITAKTACELLDFAFLHKTRRLEMAILKCIQNGTINIDQMEEHLSSTVDKNDD